MDDSNYYNINDDDDLIERLQDRLLYDAGALHDRITRVIMALHEMRHQFFIPPVSLSKKGMAILTAKTNALCLYPFYTKGLESGLWDEYEYLNDTIFWERCIEKVDAFNFEVVTDILKSSTCPYTVMDEFDNYRNISDNMYEVLYEHYLPDILYLLNLPKDCLAVSFMRGVMRDYLSEFREYLDYNFDF